MADFTAASGAFFSAAFATFTVSGFALTELDFAFDLAVCAFDAGAFADVALDAAGFEATLFDADALALAGFFAVDLLPPRAAADAFDLRTAAADLDFAAAGLAVFRVIFLRAAMGQNLQTRDVHP